MRCLKILVLILTIIAIVGCGSGFRVPYINDSKQRTIEARLLTSIPQKEIDARITTTNTGATIGVQFGFIGGAIGAALDASSNNNSLFQKEKQLTKLRDALTNFDLNNLHYQKMILAIENFKQIKLVESKSENSVKTSSLVIDAIYIEIVSSYILVRNFSSLEFTTDITLFKAHKTNTSMKNRKRIKSGNILYRNRYKYISPTMTLAWKNREEKLEGEEKINLWFIQEIEKLNTAQNNKFKMKKRRLSKQKRKKMEQNSKGYTFSETNFEMGIKWSFDNANLIKSYFHEALVETANMIRTDFMSAETNEEFKKDKSIKLIQPGLQFVSEKDNRIIIRDIYSDMAGQLCSMTKSTFKKRCWKAL